MPLPKDLKANVRTCCEGVLTKKANFSLLGQFLCHSRMLLSVRLDSPPWTDKLTQEQIIGYRPAKFQLPLSLETKTERGCENGEIPQDYRNAITQVVRQRQASDRNLHLLDGLQLINDPLYLWVTDVVHPNDAGSQRMADGVASALKPLLKSLLRAP